MAAAATRFETDPGGWTLADCVCRRLAYASGGQVFHSPLHDRWERRARDRQLWQHRVSWHRLEWRGTTLSRASGKPLESLLKGTVESLLSLRAAGVLRLQVSDAVEIRLVRVESETGVLLYSPSDMPHPRGEIRRKAEGPLSLFPCPYPLDAPYLNPQFPYP